MDLMIVTFAAAVVSHPYWRQTLGAVHFINHRNVWLSWSLYSFKHFLCAVVLTQIMRKWYYATVLLFCVDEEPQGSLNIRFNSNFAVYGHQSTKVALEKPKVAAYFENVD